MDGCVLDLRQHVSGVSVLRDFTDFTQGKVKSRFRETHILFSEKANLVKKSLFFAPDCTKLISRLKTFPGGAALGPP